MNIKIQATGFELTGAINDYVNKKIGGLSKFLKKEDGSVLVLVEVSKTTQHHKQGELFRAEINVRMPSSEFRAVSESEDLYSAVDDAKDSIEQEIVSYKDKKRTNFRKGASMVKDLIKGFAKFKWKNSSKFPRFKGK